MNTTGMFSRSADDVDVDDLPDQGGIQLPRALAPRAGSRRPGVRVYRRGIDRAGRELVVGNRGGGEEEMRRPFAATTRAMDRVTAAAAAAEYNLQAASLLASRDTGTVAWSCPSSNRWMPSSARSGSGGGA